MVQLLQNVLLYSHITLGTIAVLSGSVALVSTKGATIHIRFGRVFATAMILSSLLGAVLGLVNYAEFYITFLAGILSLTLVASSLLTLRSGSRAFSSRAVAAINFLNAVAITFAGTIAVGNPEESLFGFPAEDYFLLAGIALIGLIGDVSYFLRKKVTPNQRIARHLWRMCLGFFIAAGSAFTGPGQSAFPESIQQSGILSLPELVIFILMVFYIVRTRSSSRSKPRST